MRIPLLYTAAVRSGRRRTETEIRDRTDELLRLVGLIDKADARPIESHQPPPGRGRHALDRLLVPPGELLHEVLDQQRNVLAAFDQARQHDRHDLESMVEVTAERAERDFLGPYLRRILALAVFGAAHYIFLWSGDILFSYAVAAGALLILLYGKWKPILIALAILAGVGFIPEFDAVWVIAGGWPRDLHYLLRLRSSSSRAFSSSLRLSSRASLPFLPRRSPSCCGGAGAAAGFATGTG